MVVKIRDMKCPACKSNTNLDIPIGLTAVYCPFCNEKIAIEKIS